MHVRIAGLSLLLLVSVFVQKTFAQSGSFEINQFRPSETPNEGFTVSTADDFGHLRFGAQIYLDYSDDALVMEDTTGESRQVVHQQLTGSLQLSLGLIDRIVVFAGMPYHFILREDSSDNFALGAPSLTNFLPSGQGIGDFWIGARGRIWGESEDLFQIALQGTLNVHTAALHSSRQYLAGGADGSPQISGRPEVLFTFNLWKQRIRLSGNLGMEVRPRVSALNLNVGDDLTFGVGGIVSVLTGEHGLDVIAEMFGRVGLSEKLGSSGFANSAESPIELLAGAKYHHKDTGISAGAGAGFGVQRGYGSPDYRIFGMIGYAFPEKEEAAAAKPVRASRDQDGDGIADNDDKCPAEAEDKDEFEDSDGCPDFDNDFDNVLDVDDECRDKPGPVENRGCPEPDRDGDGVIDRVDNCPDEPGPKENQGCQKKQLVQITDDRIDIVEKIYFTLGSAKVQKRSFALLDNVAAVLIAHPEIAKINVEGHTDSRGSDASNQKLSQRRVDSVVKYLVNKGVDASRLTPIGYGESRPVAPDAKTDIEHEQNRRVEFVIVQ